jgi:hypothetical protein
MGWVHHFPLAELQKRFDTQVFFETGIGNGDAIIQAQKLPFKHIYSVEIMPEQVSRMRKKFKDDPRVQIFEGDSLTCLGAIDCLVPYDINIMFWLDAHFPGADIGMGRHDDASHDDAKIRLPLEEELLVIKELRFGKDVILFDDLKIYRNQGKDAWRNDIKPRHAFSSDKFYEEILAETHNAITEDDDTGYCRLLPKNA